ncbi:hypothetical protein [Sphingomonas colocasiae]|uniref:hypothetical protein n=1 Tax=Sphingomonas colocasiae TaxID=1848973 RepID=UPI001FECA862|nr:hypothetical protein [Sphingomonas colocasiae]
MTEERITERTDAAGNVTERIIERGAPGTTVVERRGGGSVIIAIILVAMIAVVAFFMLDMNRGETRKDDAVADAAGKVGDSAKKIGDAAEKAADKLTGDEKK